jgi:hypothetical protein
VHAQKKRAASAAAIAKKKKQRRLMCVLLPLMILAVLGGIGAAVGVTISQQRSALKSRGPVVPTPPTNFAGIGPPPPLTYKINITLPVDEDGSAPTCGELFSPKNGAKNTEVGCLTVGGLTPKRASRSSTSLPAQPRSALTLCAVVVVQLLPPPSAVLPANLQKRVCIGAEAAADRRQHQQRGVRRQATPQQQRRWGWCSTSREASAQTVAAGSRRQQQQQLPQAGSSSPGGDADDGVLSAIAD